MYESKNIHYGGKLFNKDMKWKQEESFAVIEILITTNVKTGSGSSIATDIVRVWTNAHVLINFISFLL